MEIEFKFIFFVVFTFFEDVAEFKELVSKMLHYACIIRFESKNVYISQNMKRLIIKDKRLSRTIR